MTGTSKSYKPALIVVDVQEDFCPPNGTLAVPSARTILPTINTLLALPFSLKIATKDWHPPSHISFAPNHPAPANIPFRTTITIPNPLNASETERTLLWPVHCVQGTPGAALVPELDTQRLTHTVEKGQDERVEMYSAFRAPFRDPVMGESGLGGILREAGVTDVVIVGLAFDYCVKATALHAVEDGFRTCVVREGTRAVDAEKWDEVVRELEEGGVRVVGVEGEEMRRVRKYGREA